MLLKQDKHSLRKQLKRKFYVQEEIELSSSTGMNKYQTNMDTEISFGQFFSTN